MCPFMFITFICWIFLLLLQISSAVITVTFHPSTASLNLTETKLGSLNYSLRCSTQDFGTYKWLVDAPNVADVEFNNTEDKLVKADDETCSGQKQMNLAIRAHFLGYSHARLKKQEKDGQTSNELMIRVTRDKDLIGKIFVASVIVIVCITYVNMGSALDLDVVIDVIKRPVTPAIGIFCQYVIMPLLSFGVGLLLLDKAYLRLGLFIFGCSPGGGASNMWAVLLNGNLNLSIAMTFISTLFSFFVMPFWLYTLGRTIYADTTISPPVQNILSTLLTMFVCLAIGLVNKKFFPRVANVSRRILAPFSVAMIIFIIVFGTYANLYMFKVMTWQIFMATAANVWFGMLWGLVMSWVCHKSIEDSITIAIETGVQNTGVSIAVLGFLGQPDADLASAVPVAASIMTPIPLTLAYICIKTRNYYRRKYHKPISCDNFESLNGKLDSIGNGVVNAHPTNIASIDISSPRPYQSVEFPDSSNGAVITGNV